MAYKKTKWKEVYEVLKERILDGTYPPGSEFPSNKEIGEEFGIHPSSITLATSALMREGLLFEPTRKAMRRTVRTVPIRSMRKGGFFADSAATGKAHKELVELKIIKDQGELPEAVQKEMKVPVLYYHHNQFVNDTLVANSRSFIPNLFPLDELNRRLSVEGARLYKSLEALGHKPTMVEEELIAAAATEEDNKLLNLPENSSVTVARIDRRVYDDDGNLVEFCYLTDRADCYIFSYRFPLY